MSDKYCVLQDDAKDCGVCSLLSIIKYYSGDVSKEYLRELSKTTNNGVSALNLLKSARELGFEAYGVRGKLEDINKKYLPVIAHVIIDKKYPHFVVIYKMDIRKNKIVVMDPAKGFIAYKISSFLNISTNNYLIMRPKQVIPKLANESDYLEKIKVILTKYKIVIILISLMSFFFTIINVLESYHFQLLFNGFNNIDKSSIKIVLLFLLIFIFFKYIIDYCRNNLIVLFNNTLDKSLVKDAFYHVINLPYLYYSNHTTGDLLTRINDLGNVKELISNLIACFFVDFLLAIIIIIFMIKSNIELTIISIVCLFIYGIIVLINSVVIKKIIRENHENSSLVNNYLIESLSSFETIKNFSIENYVFKEFMIKYGNYNDVAKILFKRINNQKVIQGTILSIGSLLIIYDGIKMVYSNSISLPTLVTYMALFNYLITPVRNILGLYLEYANAKESIRRIKEIYHIPQENKLVFKHAIKELKGDIFINNVSYSYNGIDKVIDNVSMEVNEGEKVLLYGQSGSGKSTLMRLLIKYLDNNYNGNITIGGYDLKDIDIFSLRNNICYVSQNEYLYTNSIYENITLGKKIKYEDFIKISNNLFVNEIIKNSSLGYNFVIENNGENISGGEKERIILARSILKHANIYIYDESFSEIDIKRERSILKYIFNLYPNKTFIVISHRLSNEDLFSKKIMIGGE